MRSAPTTALLSLLAPLTLAAVALASWSGAAQDEIRATDGPSEVSNADTATVDALVDAMYAAVSGANGTERDWDRFRALFHPELGRISGIVQRQGGDPALVTYGPDDYVERTASFLDARGFYQRAAARRTEEFGQIAQCFVTVEMRSTPESEPFRRAIHAFQLYKSEGRWSITSLLQNAESEEHPLPERYLESPK